MTPLREGDAQSLADVLDDPACTTDQTVQLLYEEAKRRLSSGALHLFLARFSYSYFARFYLPHYFSKPFSPPYHGDMFKLLRAVETGRTRMPAVIIAWPESGKTTCCGLLMPLHNVTCGCRLEFPSGAIVDKTKRYIQYVSATLDIARKNMLPLVTELEENVRLRTDFGELVRDPLIRTNAGRIWSKTQARTLNDIFIEARGRKMKLRSTRHRQYRPDLGICTDLDDDGADRGAEKSQHRSDMMSWFLTVYMPRISIEHGNILAEGNRIHGQSLISRLYDYGAANDWHVRDYKPISIDEYGNKQYLWPEKFGPAWEAETRKRMMDRPGVFEATWMNDTTRGLVELTYDQVQYYDESQLADVLRRAEIYIAMDPAATQEERNDYTAVVAIAFDPDTGITYVLPSMNERLGIDGQATAFFSTYLRYYDFDVRRIGVEAVAYQNVLAPYITSFLAKKGITEKVYPLHQRRQKFSRYRRLFPAIAVGNIRFCAACPEHAILLNQLIAVAKRNEPDHDDLADALEMADRLKNECHAEDYDLEVSGDVDVDLLRLLEKGEAKARSDQEPIEADEDAAHIIGVEQMDDGDLEDDDEAPERRGGGDDSITDIMI